MHSVRGKVLHTVLAISAVTALAPVHAAFAWTAEIREAAGMKGLKGVVIEPRKIELTEPAPGQLRALLRGTFDREGWSLLTDGRERVAAGSEKHAFEHEVKVTGPLVPIKLTAIGPRGEARTTKLELVFDEYAKYANPPPPKRWSLNGSLGYSFIDYDQPGETKFQEHALTVKGGASYRLGAESRWDLGLSGYYTLLPLSTNEPRGIEARFLGLNLRAGYVLPWLGPPWRLALLFGAYYVTMFVPNDAFGFSDLSGPQLFPTLSRAIGPRDTLSAYFKLSPVSQSFALLDLSSREIAFGLGYAREVAAGRSLIASLDVSFLNIDLGPAERIDTDTISLSAGYAF